MAVPDLYEEKSGERYYDREKFTSRHALMCDMHIAGMSNNDIASALDCSHVTVSVILGDARAKSYIKEQRDLIAASTPDIYKKLECYAHEAVDELVRQMRFGTKDDKVKQTAAFGILDRLGFSPIKKEITAKADIPLSDKHAEKMERLLDESKEIKAKFRFEEPESRETDPHVRAAEEAVNA